jgi:hypothetical protein
MSFQARHMAMPEVHAISKKGNQVSEDRRLQKMAFPFIQVAPRPSKPRKSGLTIVADRGMGMHRVEDLLESSGEYIDYVKVAIGAFRLQSEAFLKRKINALQKAGIRVFFAGDACETAFMQGVSKDLYKKVKQLGAEAVEVSNAQISVSLQVRRGTKIGPTARLMFSRRSMLTSRPVRGKFWFRGRASAKAWPSSKVT